MTQYILHDKNAAAIPASRDMYIKKKNVFCTTKVLQLQTRKLKMAEIVLH